MAKLVTALIGPPGVGKSELGKFLNSPEGRAILAKYFIDDELRYEPEQSDPAGREMFYRDIIEGKPYPADGFELLQLLLREKRYGLMFNHQGIGILDTSMIGALQTFGKNSFQSGILSNKGLRKLNLGLEDAIDSLGRTPQLQKRWLESLLVYLRAPPEVSMSRIKTRGDPREKDMQKSYLESLYDCNEQFIISVGDSYDVRSKLKPLVNRNDPYTNLGLIPPRVLVLDATIDLTSNPKCLEDHTNKIAQEIKKLVESE